MANARGKNHKFAGSSSPQLSSTAPRLLNIRSAGQHVIFTSSSFMCYSAVSWRPSFGILVLFSDGPESNSAQIIIVSAQDIRCQPMSNQERVMGTRKTTPRKVKDRPPSGSRIEKPIELSDGMRERISLKAYELWEQRGRQEGNAIQNWLDAEQLVMQEIPEARE